MAALLVLTGCSGAQAEKKSESAGESSSFADSFLVDESEVPSSKEDVPKPEDLETMLGEQFGGISGRQIVPMGETAEEFQFEWQVLDAWKSKTLEGFNPDDVWHLEGLDFDGENIHDDESFFYIKIRIKNTHTLTLTINFHNFMLAAFKDDFKEILTYYEFQTFDRKAFTGPHDGAKYSFEPGEEIETTLLYMIEDEYDEEEFYLSLTEIYSLPTLKTTCLALSEAE